MKLKKIKELESVVRKVLENDPKTRDDDCRLIFEVVIQMHPDTAGETFANVMFGAKEKKISFESITRARRKLQQVHPELRGNSVEARKDEEYEYEKYSKI